MRKDRGASRKKERAAKQAKAAKSGTCSVKDGGNHAGRFRVTGGRKDDCAGHFRVSDGRKGDHTCRFDADDGRDNYCIYRLSRKEWVKYAAVYLAFDAAVAYLFFESYLAFLLLLPGIFWFFRERAGALQKKRAARLRIQFLDGIQMMAASLQAGYSAENALRESVKELVKIYEPNAIIVREFRLISAQLSMSRSLEELFLDFGRRSAVEDIVSFAEVLVTAKRSGGDLLAVIRNTASCIRQKQETVQEIETSLAGKIMEQNIMSMIPIGILAYIKLSSPEFLAAMYGNVTGITVMTLCFLVYVAAYFWGRRIVQIEV